MSCKNALIASLVISSLGLLSGCAFEAQGSSSQEEQPPLASSDDALSATSRGGYLWADQATAQTVYSPSSNYSSNGRHQVQRTDVGKYVVQLWGMAATPNVQVSAYGGTSVPLACKVQNVAAPVRTRRDWATLVYVNCFDIDGVPADSQFTLSYVVRDSSPGPEGAYFSSDSNGSVTNDWNWAPWNARGGPITVQKAGRGRYDVTVPDHGTERLVPFPTMAQVTATGSDSNVCVGTNDLFASVLRFRVTCFDVIGTPQDTAFSMNIAWSVVPNGAPTYSIGTRGFIDLTKQAAPLHQACASSELPAPTVDSPFPGEYVITFQGMPNQFDDSGAAIATSNVMVFPWGRIDKTSCRVNYWFGAPPQATVDCFDDAGRPVESSLSIAYSASNPCP